MTQDLQISIDRIRAATDILLAHISAVSGGSVALDVDYFWSVPPDETYAVYDRPGELTIGQLSESWEHIEKVLDEPDDAISYHLVWLADILKAVGYKSPP